MSNPRSFKAVTRSTSSYLYLTSAMLILGASVVASKVIAETMPIYTASVIRQLLAAVILIAIVGRAGGIPRLPPRLHLVLLLQALTGMVLFNVLLLLGLGMTTAIAGGIITSSTPAVIAVMSVTLGDRLRPAGWLGVALAVLGMVIVNLFATADASDARRPALGAVLVFLAVIAEALYTILGKIAAPSLKPIPMATLVTIYGLILFLPLAATDVGDFRPSQIPASGWFALVFLASFVTVGAFVLWLQGLRHVPASTAGAFTGMIPVGTVVAAALFLDEPITWLHIAGVATAICGIVLVTRALRPVSGALPPGSTIGATTSQVEAARSR